MKFKNYIKNSIIYDIKQNIDFRIFKRHWIKNNQHNFTIPQNKFDLSLVKVGNETYGDLNIISFNNKSKLFIGNFCSIGQNVRFILNAEHNLNYISTYPFKVGLLKTERYEAISKGDIIVDDDVWIGYGATIMSGVHIHQGAVIATGAIVTKDVPPYAIVGGIPSKIIKYRFPKDIIEELLKIDFSKLTKKEIEKNIDKLYSTLKDKSQLDWLPKK